MDPAQHIIGKFGGPSVVARIVGVHRTRVSSWQRSREAGGTGGRIPQDHIPALLEYARKAGLNLTADDFLGTAPPTAPEQGEPATQPEPAASGEDNEKWGVT